MKLIADKEITNFTISVEIIKGVVRLTETADTRTEAGKAAAIARGVAGVKSVVNEIRSQAAITGGLHELGHC